jgi:hypothetical protein
MTGIGLREKNQLYISNSSIETYGGIYEAPTNGPTGGNPYGTYDYCSVSFSFGG